MYLPYPSENVEVEKLKANDWEKSCAKEPGPVDIEPETRSNVKIMKLNPISVWQNIFPILPDIVRILP